MILSHYNTLIVLAGVSSLGLAGGLLGAFLQLRHHSLLSDAISHATFPGIGIAFLISFLIGSTSTFSVLLLFGAAISSILSILFLVFLNRATKLKEDTNLAIVISLFFGVGAFLFGLIQKLSTGSAAGLNRFIYGKTASLLVSDAILMASIALCIVCVLVLCFKEFNVFLFDKEFAQVEGYPVTKIDLLLSMLSLILVVLGLQAVGLILIIALFILPSVAARCWTHSIRCMAILSSVFGLFASISGALWSAYFENLPAGALIVLCMGAIFLLSFLWGREKGFVYACLQRRNIRRDRNLSLLLQSFSHLIKETPRTSILNALTASPHIEMPCLDRKTLMYLTRWTPILCRRTLHSARKKKWISITPKGVSLSSAGLAQAIEELRIHEWQHLFVRMYPDRAQHIPRMSQDAEKETRLIPMLEEKFPWLFNADIDSVRRNS